MLPKEAKLPPSDIIGSTVIELQQFASSYYDYQIDQNPDPFLRVVMGRALKSRTVFEVGSEFYDRYLTLSLNQDRDHDDYFDLGIDIGSDIIDASKNDRDKILYFMNAYNAMNYMQSAITMSDDSEPEAVHNRVAQLAAFTILDSIKDREKFQNLAITVMSTIEGFAREIQPLEATTKQLTSLNNALILLLGLNNNLRIDQGSSRAKLLEGYVSSNSEELSENEINRLCNLLTKEAMSHRKYGTKPAYIEASIGGSWLFYDGEYFKEQMGYASDISSNLAAVILHTPKDKLNDLRILANPMDSTEDSLIHVGGAGQDNDLIIYVTHDGVLATDQFGLNSLEKMFPDNISGAQKLKAEIVSYFWDLSMPLYKRASAPKNYPGMTDGEKADFDPIQQLLIPRIKLLNEPERAHSDITRTLREHDVTWFVRLLPDGFHPSPEAVAEAAQHGIILAENETFVKAHKRGVTNAPILGYHAVKR